MAGKPKIAEHGTTTRYTQGCHCQECRNAQTSYQTKRRQRRAKDLLADPTLAEHGRYSTYLNWLCKCDPCKAAYRRYADGKKDRRKERDQRAKAAQANG